MHGRAVTGLALLGVLGVLVPSSATAQPESDGEAFERVFKRRSISEHVPVVLIVGGEAFGALNVELQHGTAVRVPASILLDALATRRARPGIRAQLSRAVRGLQLAIDDLRAAGLDVVYDPARLEIRIGLAPEQTVTSSHTLGSGVPAEAETAIRPSDVSGYANLFGHGGTATPQSVRVESAINVHRWVLEARGELGSSPIGAHRGDVLLSRDVTRHALRYLAGDFAVAAGGLQPGFPILGVGVTRNFTLQPYRVLQPIGAFEFTLDRPAKVTVLINGATVQTLDLPAGRHDVRDLPLGAGVNDIELLIRDDAGVERRLQFSAASPNGLLAPGVVQFSVSLGFPLIADTGFRDYEWSRPIASARRRWGVSNHLTLGGSFDGDFDRQVAGAAFVVATKLGNLAVDTAISHDTVSQVGHAEGVRYDYHGMIAGAPGSTFTALARHYSPAFRSLDVVAVDSRYSDELSIASSRKLVARVFGRLNARYQIGRDIPDAFDASLALSRSFGGLSLDALVGVRETSSDVRDVRIFVSVNWRLPDRSLVQAFSRTSTSAGMSNEVRYTTPPGPPPDGLVASAGLRKSRDASGADATIAYGSDRFTSSITGVTSFDRNAAATTNGSFDVGTAVAFAGGRVAWSRPITGSFAIVDRIETLADQQIGVNPVAGSYSARANRFGPAVVTSLEAYRLGSVRVEAPSLRAGTSLGPASYAVMPTYKSGTLLVVGEPGTVFLRGSILHPDGTPVQMGIGELVPSDAPKSFRNAWVTELQARLDLFSEREPSSRRTSPLVLMTNRAGRFSVVGVDPGSYEIRIAAGSPIWIEVPAGTTGVYSAGVLKMKPSPAKDGRTINNERENADAEHPSSR